MKAELTTALRIVWHIVSFCLLLVLAAPFLLSRETLLSSIPVCRWKALYNRECALCGMSTAFVLLAEGRIGEARERNAAAVPLSLLMLVNGVISIASLIRYVCSSHNTTKSHHSHSPPP